LEGTGVSKFPRWGESLLVPDNSQAVVTSILYSTNSAVAEQRLDAGRARCRHAIRLVRQTSSVLTKLDGLARIMQLGRRYDTQRLNRYSEIIRSLDQPEAASKWLHGSGHGGKRGCLAFSERSPLQQVSRSSGASHSRTARSAHESGRPTPPASGALPCESIRSPPNFRFRTLAGDPLAGFRFRRRRLRLFFC
jgi:hypothetical protein